MRIVDNPDTGTIVDPIDSNESQEDLNVYLLIDHDKMSILDCLDKPTNKYDLKFWMERIPEEDTPFWETVLKRIITLFNLNSLKMYVSVINMPDNVAEKTRDLLFFLKAQYPDFIKSHPIEAKNISSLRDFFKFLVELKHNPDYEEYTPPELMFLAIKDIDRESFQLFIQKLKSNNF